MKYNEHGEITRGVRVRNGEFGIITLEGGRTHIRLIAGEVTRAIKIFSQEEDLLPASGSFCFEGSGDQEPDYSHLNQISSVQALL